MSGSAKVRKDVDLLALRVAFVPREAHPALAARIMADGLMLPTQWWTSALYRLVKWRHGIDSFSAWAMIFTRAPQAASDLIGQTADWIKSGKDAGGEGIGGFDQREFDRMTALVARLDLTA